MTPRELAAAIRKGAKLRPQATGVLFKNGASCVFGAALEAMGGAYKEGAMFEYIREVLGGRKSHYDYFCLTSEQFDEIWTKNDTGQTREQIADWLDTLDPEKPADNQSFDAFMATVMKPVEVALREMDIN